MNLQYAIASEIGPRTANEDAVGVWPAAPETFAAAVADGLGGYHGGQRASAIAISMFGAAIAEAPIPDLYKVASAIHDAIREEQKKDSNIRGMATTLSAAIIVERTLKFVHCGDTRINLQRNNGIRRLTMDHTEAQRLLEAGSITQEEYAIYPRKNVLESALGITSTPRIDVGSHDLIPGDRIFITSDGVHSKVYMKELRDISVRSANPQQAVSEIVRVVNQKGPEDNFTAISIFL